MSDPVLDFWFDFASTYSYPAALRIRSFAQRAGVSVRFRPFLLGPIFKAQGWQTSPFNLYEVKGRNMWRDLQRICADLCSSGRSRSRRNSLLGARVALVGLAQGWGEGFCEALYRSQFGEGRRIDEPATVAAVLAALNLDATPVLAAAHSDAIKSQLRRQTEEAQRLGIFGAPSFVTADGELFWGNDRLERALLWAKWGR